MMRWLAAMAESDLLKTFINAPSHAEKVPI
jgi:hypothetical protein